MIQKIKIIFQTLLAFLFAFVLAGCGNASSSAAAPTSDNSGAGVGEPSILSLWKSQTSAGTLDLSQLILEQAMSSDLILPCTGNFGNTGKVNGMDRGQVKLSGTPKAGYLFVGHLKYVGGSKQCSDMSKELYSYSVTNGVLTFCALNWNACGTYTP